MNFDIINPIIKIENAVFTELHNNLIDKFGINQFSLNAGEIIVIKTENAMEAEFIEDMFLGLCNPQSGQIYLNNKSLADVNNREIYQFRFKTGKITNKNLWINNLSMLENIILPYLYHTDLGYEAIVNEVNFWAEIFGKNTIPDIRPAFDNPESLVISGWVRAFSGNKSFIIIEQPLPDNPVNTQLLFAAISKKLLLQSSVVWIYHSNKLMNEEFFKTSRKYCVKDNCLS